MTNSAIKPYPIKPIAAELPVDPALAQALLASVDEHREQLRGRRIWLACSGGRDSLVLAALCLQLYQQGKLAFLPQLLHVDHNLQSASSHWAKHVAKWAQVQQLPCTILRAQVTGSDEQAARQARYQVMLEHINQGDVLLLGHHADDQAETVLMRLMQGAGVKGLAAMQAWREQSQGARHNVLWRPWLSVRRANISSYAEQLQLPYIDDPTNDNGDNVRSSLRRDIMPLLATYNPNVIENMVRSAQLLSDAQATVNTQALQDWQQTAIDELDYPSAQRVIDSDQLQALPLYRQRQLLHYWLAQDEPLPPSKQLVDDVSRLVQRDDNDHQTQLDWYAHRQHYRVSRYRQQLYRLSHSWLDWLALPVLVQQQVIIKDRLEPFTVVLRENAAYHWQLKVTASELAPLMSNDTDPLTLKITPLDRQQKLKTSRATRAQSGKKLYQTLAIPVWLRDSLLVVSAVNLNSEVTGSKAVNSEHKADNNELPLLLISPFEQWPLTADSASLNLSNNDPKWIAKIVNSAFSSTISSALFAVK